MNNPLQSILMKNWIAALEKENPEMGFTCHFGVNPDCNSVWYPHHNVLFTADVNVAHRLMSKPQIREAFCDAPKFADAAIMRAMKQ